MKKEFFGGARMLLEKGTSRALATIVCSFAMIFFAMSCAVHATQPGHDQATSVKASPAHGTQEPSRTKTRGYAAGQILTKFKEKTAPQAIESIQNQLHLETIRIVSRPNLYLMKITGGSSVEEMIRRLQEFEEVEYSEPNYIRRTTR